MRVIALDYGSARTGVAISDPTGTIATPHPAILRAGSRKGRRELLRLIASSAAERVLVGLPLSLRGHDTDQTREARAFAATLAAFGQSLSLTTLAIIYLTGTAIGSAVPTPGGVGAVEGALSLGLTTAGVATATATSTAVLFRVLTFWVRVPIGWFALRHLQKRNLV